ncbi:MAG: nuclear transport factor 2 family protein [Novosphingobium sp.]
MSSNRDAVAFFYEALATGDAASALGAMAEDIIWIGMEGWPYRAVGRGRTAVAEGILAPMMADWEDVTVIAASIIDAGDVVVATGHYGGVHRTTRKTLDAAFAHLWTVSDGALASFRQYTDTLIVDRAMR